MRTTSVICPMIVLAILNVAAAESLERRFGPDREKGHRSEREFEGSARRLQESRSRQLPWN
jgi:hypothetical protein